MFTSDNAAAANAKRRRRAGGGGKPKAFTQLKRRIESERKDDAEYAFALYASVMRDTGQPLELRLDCGREIMNRVIGKPREQHEITGANGGPIETKDVSLTDEQRIIRIAALLDAARTRRDGPATGNTG